MHSKLDRVRQVDWDEIEALKSKKASPPRPLFLTLGPRKYVLVQNHNLLIRLNLLCNTVEGLLLQLSSSNSSMLDMHSKLDRVRQVDWDEIKGIRLA